MKTKFIAHPQLPFPHHDRKKEVVKTVAIHQNTVYCASLSGKRTTFMKNRKYSCGKIWQKGGLAAMK